MSKTSLRNNLMIATGVLAFGLGVTGIFIPLLPTTPFLLLAATCFFRSSDRLYNWLIHHKWFGKYIRHYREFKSITLNAKVATLLLLWSVIGYTAFAFVRVWWVRVLLGIIAISVTVHIVRLKTLTRDMLVKVPTEIKTE